jgi:poly(3-hydroxybutyrate) depolymerase
MRTSRNRLVAVFLGIANGLFSLPCSAEKMEFTYRNSFDGSEQLAVAYVPEICKEREDNPLLVIAHPAGGTRHSCDYYYEECEARGWLLVVPDLHGRRAPGQMCWAALEAQHDLIDAVAHMQANYSVDPARIYIAGRSMGGALAATTAAKYPDLFAAAVAGQGVFDMKNFTLEYNQDWHAEFGGPYSDETRFAYERYSAISFAPNFSYVPLILWHGTHDRIVPPEQSEQLLAAIRRYNRFQPDINWLLAAPHSPINYPPAWIMDQLQYYRNVSESGKHPRFPFDLHLVTDEDKQFYWLRITPEKEHFAEVRASASNDGISILSTNATQVDVSLDRFLPQINLKRYKVETTTGPVHLSISRGDSVLFSARVERTQSGELPGTIPQ